MVFVLFCFFLPVHSDLHVYQAEAGANKKPVTGQKTMSLQIQVSTIKSVTTQPLFAELSFTITKTLTHQ